jgi:hypothetical protein
VIFEQHAADAVSRAAAAECSGDNGLASIAPGVHCAFIADTPSRSQNRGASDLSGHRKLFDAERRAAFDDDFQRRRNHDARQN